MSYSIVVSGLAYMRIKPAHKTLFIERTTLSWLLNNWRSRTSRERQRFLGQHLVIQWYFWVQDSALGMWSFIRSAGYAKFDGFLQYVSRNDVTSLRKIPQVMATMGSFSGRRSDIMADGGTLSVRCRTDNVSPSVGYRVFRTLTITASGHAFHLTWLLSVM